MKKQILALLTAAVMVLTMAPAMAFAETETITSVQIEINEENFPDDNFREIVMDIDQYDDGVLMEKEIRETQYLNLDNEGICDLTGIQYFTNLQELYCNGNQLTSLDLTGLSELANLDCSDNQLTSLNIIDCESLIELRAHHNHLTTLELNPDAGYSTIHVHYNDFADKSAIKCNGNTMEWAMEYTFHPQNWVTPVDLNEVNFPDFAFRSELTRYDYNKDNVLSPGEITDIYSIDLNNSGVENLEGIQHLIVLEDLDCTACYLTELPQLPAELKTLYVTYNYLTELPELPKTLKKLWCYDNQLTSLPELPDSIEMIQCERNYLTELPELPESLTYLNCSGNRITELPELPVGLDELWCSYNQLEQLPVLPEAMESLLCNNNKMTELPELPDALTGLQCYENQIKTLPELPAKLQTLYAHKNKISGVLDLSQLKFLTYVDVSDNMITGIKLNPYAKYGSMWVSDNAMKSESDVTGRSDIVWGENGYYFGNQKTACEINGHSFKKTTSKATFKTGGESVRKCTICGEIDYREKYAAVTVPKNITKVYSGSVLAAPKFVVKTSTGTTLKQGTDYTVKKVTSAKLKNVGKYKYKITLQGAKYKGVTYAYVTVNPKATVINKLTKPVKRQIKVTWQKRTAQVTGYQIRYSRKQSMDGAAIVKVKSFKTNTKTVKNLKAKKKYWVQVRTYKNVNGKAYYSAWSAKKSITTK